MAEDSDDDKPFEPSQRRLEHARERGEVIRAPELAAAIAIVGLTAALAVAGGRDILASAGMLTRFLAAPDRLTGATGLAPAPIAALAVRSVGALLPIFLAPGLLVLALLLSTRAITFSPQKLSPRWSRIFSAKGMFRKFGPAGLVDAAKGMVKFAIVGLAAAQAVASNLGTILGAEHLPAAQALDQMMRIALVMLIHIAAAWLALGLVDLLWQRHDFLKRQRMTRREMMDEMKDAEGDPHAKQQRRRRGQDIAMNQMIAEVAKTDVVIVNPTHYAVALKWNRSGQRAPICLAKGTDAVAARIREAAMTAGVPIHSDPPTARALHAQIEIGDEIHPDHYKAVAAAIRFAEAMRKRARQGRR